MDDVESQQVANKKQEPLEYQQSALQIMQAFPKNIRGYIEL